MLGDTLGPSLLGILEPDQFQFTLLDQVDS